MKINKHEIWLALTQLANFEVSKIYQGIVQSLYRLLRVFFDTLTVIFFL